MTLRQRTNPPDGPGGPGDARGSIERMYDRDGTRCYSLALELLEAPAIAAEVVGWVLVDAVRSGPEAQTRTQLLNEVHRRSVARLRERPRRPDPTPAETRAWNRIDDPSVREVLSDMPALARRAALMVYFAGYRVRELAESLDRTPEELRAALYTAIVILRRDPRTSRKRT